MILRDFARFVAAGFGAGFVPRAPGTAGALVGVALAAVLLAWGWPALGLATIVFAAGGVWAIGACGLPQSGLSTSGADPGWVVIDEIAGQCVALLPLHRPAWPGLLLGFVLFRLFDILKPGPVGWIDRRHGPWAVMGDDLAAGVLAALALWLLRAAIGPALLG